MVSSLPRAIRIACVALLVAACGDSTAPPPVASRIAVAAGDGVWLFEPDDGSWRRLIDGAAAEVAWNHDGSRLIASNHYVDWFTTSWLQEYSAVTWSAIRNFVHVGISAPAYARDGRLAYAGKSATEYASPDLYIDGNLRVLGVATEGGVFGGGGLAWTPDSKFVLNMLAEPDGAGNLQVGLYRIDPVSGTRVPHFPGSDERYFDVAFTTDGTRFLFTRNSPPSGTSIWTARADGTDARQLTNGNGDRSPSWCASETQIAFMRDYRVMIMNADGSGLFELRVPTTAFLSDVACAPR